VLLEYYTGVTVSGTVRDAGGQPMPGVGVTFIDGTGARHGIASTDANGTYSVVAPFSDAGDLRLAVLAQNTEIFNRTDVQVSRGETAPRTGIDLTVPFASLSGIAYENRDGVAGFNATADRPLEGVQVSAGPHNTTSGSDGRYTLANLPAGAYAVRGSLPGYNDGSQSVVAKGGASAVADLVLTVKSSTVTLRFLDGGQPVEKVPLSITGVATRSVTTNAQGNATAVLAPGAYHVKVDYNVTKDGALTRYQADQDFTVPAGGAPIVVVVNRSS
jgi:hypothetical protein